MPHALVVFLRLHRRHLGELMLASVAVNVCALAPPLYSMLVYDKAVGNDLPDTLLALTLGIAIVFVLEACWSGSGCWACEITWEQCSRGDVASFPMCTKLIRMCTI